MLTQAVHSTTSRFSEIVVTTTGNLTVTQVRNSLINNYGQVADLTRTLPAPEAGMDFKVVFITEVAKYFRLAAATADGKKLNGLVRRREAEANLL